MVEDRRELHFRWQLDLESAPSRLWPLVSDTNRFNFLAGLPALADRGAEIGERSLARLLRSRALGMPLEWEEEPFEWVSPHRFGVVCRYHRGPLRSMRVLVTLEPREPRGTRLAYEVWAVPRGLFGRVALPVLLGRVTQRRFQEVLRRCDREARALPAAEAGPARLEAGGARLFADRRERLLAGGAREALLERLRGLLEEADGLTLSRLRPYALADLWGEPRREVLELCLRATRAGVLESRWDLLCPHCRGPVARAERLEEVSSESRCDGCRVDFEVNLDRLVELTFRPHPAIRRVEERAYCVGGPGLTPHVVAQAVIEPGRRTELSPSLVEGRFRLRAAGFPGALLLRASTGGQRELSIRLGPEGWPSGEMEASLAPLLRLENGSSRPAAVALERLSWDDQAATAAEVSALQAFRDLFSSEVLAPGRRISVGSLTILFTDLRGSTRLYREIGDAPAFGRVMEHFQALREAVASRRGALVKTMGDAVMAVFARPADAVRAALAAQETLGTRPGGRPLRLKAGLHHGPCIAVNQNGVLDYFGSTVNVAARLVALSSGEEVIVSGAVRSDPEAAALLAGGEGPLALEPFSVEVRGFEGERFDVFRVGRGRPAAGGG